MRTFNEVLSEILEIINSTQLVETRLQQLKAKGYQVEDCWVKNGNIGTIWYMRQKKVYRFQVTTSVLHGDYHKAYCVVIPFTELIVQVSELAKMRNTTILKKPIKTLRLVAKDNNLRSL